MKIKTLSILASSVLILASCQEEKKEDKDQGKDMGQLHLATEYPQAGDDLQISYSNDAESVDAHFYYMVNGKMYPQDLDLEDSSNLWQTTIKVPDSAQALAFNFKSEDEYDNNDKKGYILPLYNKDKKPVAGSNASMGMYYANLAPEFGAEIPADSSLALIDTDLKENKGIQKDWDRMYVSMLANSNEDKAKAYAKKRMTSYEKKELTEDENTTLLSFHQVLGNKSKVDSISKLMASKYPKGSAAKRTYAMRVYKASSLEDKLNALADYNKNVGEDSFEKDFMLSNIAEEYFKKGDQEKFKKYTNQISNSTQKASSYNSVAWNMAEKEENLDLAAELSKKSLDLINKEQKSFEGKTDFQTKKQYSKNLDRTYGMYADTYAYILFKQGNTEEAIKYQAQAVGEGNDAELNERYIEYLASAEANDKVITEAEKFIASNNATQKVKEAYKAALLNTDVDEAEADKKLSSLEAKADKLLMANIKKEMINKEAASFNLKNLAGKEVSLESLKGKTVVLDFWATWCGPCKASFPGMQKAVDKYKDNENVEILFVNTMERGDEATRTKGAKDFITSKAYSFEVLMDTPVKEGSRKYSTSSSYGITGIPTKIIIGPNGKIRFKKVGYSGNNEQMIKEIDMMIKLINS
ncbi:TlpA disulfide reductase family protein [Mesonia sp. MT50]|uniref:TlpA disulfide reductase family protein n=1 Tax=Mesonia profundi TaxID=3070998 RepID=A0ABU0ZZM1_9FLAO|nr:TlpA disulfide reductase family protein [Mesonia profundi]MDQ7916089.1 TlpA disulfide reductase family protein [Mesonia profundi]